MELEKRKIYMNRQKARIVTQVTIDEDRNVPDAKPDMERIILQKGEVEPEEVRCSEEKGTVRGKLKYDVLYAAEGGGVQSLSGNLPLNEPVRLEGVDDKDSLMLDWTVEDLDIEMIHSRKVRIRAVLTFTITADGLVQEGLVTAASANEPLETREENYQITRIAVQKRETYRVSEELEISGNKPNLGELIWREVELRGADCRALDGALAVRGELAVFAMYQGDGEHMPVQWEEFSVPFSGQMDLPDSTEEMIPDIDVRLIHSDMEAKEDADGELRMLDTEAILEMQIRLYETENVTAICDIYSPVKEAVLTEKEAAFEKILIRNSSRAKLSERVKLPEGERILQICHGSSQVMVDRIGVTEEGLEIEGALHVTVLYASADDAAPLRSVDAALPFQHLMEARNIDASCTYRLKSMAENLNVLMLGADEAEVRAGIVLEAIVLTREEMTILGDAELVPYDEEKIRKMPGIVGYRVQPGDTLWKIAKKFYTTVEGIRETNEGIGEDVKPGERLILIKQTDEITA